MTRLLLLAVVALTALTGCADDAASPAAVDVEALREGGTVVLLRHTETTRGGVDSLDTLGDCSAQRPLSDAGREQARELGDAVRALGVVPGRVLASPFCRTVETAELAFPDDDAQPDRGLLPLASVGDAGSPDRAQAEEAALALLGQEPADGTTTWLVTHVSTIEPLTGLSPEEGGAVLLRPDGDGGFDVVGEVPPGGWSALAADR